jgi:hypothetical protein
MIYEYALEPALLNNWKDCRYFLEKFGVPKGRVISRYPRKWERMVVDSLANCGDVEKQKIVEALVGLKRYLLPRHHEWNEQLDWLSNAETEHGKRPFHAVIAASNPRSQEFVLEADDLSEDNTLWRLPNLPPVQRVAMDMAQRVGPLLCFSHRILFIDPHFRPDKIQWRRPLQAFLEIATVKRRPGDLLKVEIHAKDDLETGLFTAYSKRSLPEIIPSGMTVRIFQWHERDRGEKLHNRFILTDIGGVSFGIGLDDSDGENGQTDDIQLLNEETYNLRFAQYAGSAPAFDLIAEITIIGKRRILDNAM